MNATPDGHIVASVHHVVVEYMLDCKDTAIDASFKNNMRNEDKAQN